MPSGRSLLPQERKSAVLRHWRKLNVQDFWFGEVALPRRTPTGGNNRPNRTSAFRHFKAWVGIGQFPSFGERRGERRLNGRALGGWVRCRRCQNPANPRHFGGDIGARRRVAEIGIGAGRETRFQHSPRKWQIHNVYDARNIAHAERGQVLGSRSGDARTRRKGRESDEFDPMRPPIERIAAVPKAGLCLSISAYRPAPQSRSAGLRDRMSAAVLLAPGQQRHELALL